MRVLFTAIKNEDMDKIVALISKKPELVNCIAKQPPKSDDGQSPLQISLKYHNFVAAKYFIENGANVNFMDSSSINEWKMPLLHDAIMATITFARFEFPVSPWDETKKGLYKIRGEKENFDTAFSLLKIIVDKGADVNVDDSYGNTSLMRACADINYRYTDRNRPLAKETIEDVQQVFDLLISNGADINRSTPTRDAITKMNKDLLEQLKIRA